MSFLEKYKNEIRCLNQNYLLMMDDPNVNQAMSPEAFFKMMLETSYTRKGLDKLKTALEEITATSSPEQCLEVVECATDGLITTAKFTKDQAQIWLNLLKLECMQANLGF